MATDEDEKLAKDFVNKSKTLKKGSPTLLIGYLANYLTERRLGNKTQAASELQGFTVAVSQIEGFPSSALPQVAKAVEAYGKKHARFTYKAAFMKRAGDVKKMISAGKKKGPQEVERMSQQLHRSMVSAREIPDVPYAEFAREFGTTFKDKIPMAEVVEKPKGSELAKAVAKIDWKSTMSKFKLPQCKARLEDLAMLAIKVGNKPNTKALQQAQEVLNLGKDAKAKPVELYRMTYLRLLEKGLV